MNIKHWHKCELDMFRKDSHKRASGGQSLSWAGRPPIAGPLTATRTQMAQWCHIPRPPCAQLWDVGGARRKAMARVWTPHGGHCGSEFFLSRPGSNKETLKNDYIIWGPAKPDNHIYWGRVPVTVRLSCWFKCLICLCFLLVFLSVL